MEKIEGNNTEGFYKFGLSNIIVDALKTMKYNEATRVQNEVIPNALEGKDIVCKSATGSGKTAAFAIPVCEKADWNENLPGCIILEPTRELTVQVKEEIFLIGRNKRIKVVDAFGGFPIDKQILSLKQKTHIVVGTPGRLLDHLERESLKLEKIKTVVIDEADLMLDMGFFDDVVKIIGSIKRDVQIMLFSATMDKRLDRIVDEYMKDHICIDIEPKTDESAAIEQLCYHSELDNKYNVFKHLLIKNNPDRAMIFCGTKQMTDVLCRKLARDGIRCGMLHGDIEQRDRIRTIERFKEGAFRYLIATDVAARGIDVDNLTHVFNYDFPTGRETYVHRIGRTGRNGKLGTAISIICDNDKKMFNMVKEYTGFALSIIDISCDDEIDKTVSDDFWKRQKEKMRCASKKGDGFNKTITRLSIGGGKKSKIRAVDIVGAICNIEGVNSDDIGIIDVRDSLVYVDILNSKGQEVFDSLQTKTIKGKVRKIRKTKK